MDHDLLTNTHLRNPPAKKKKTNLKTEIHFQRSENTPQNRRKARSLEAVPRLTLVQLPLFQGCFAQTSRGFPWGNKALWASFCGGAQSGDHKKGGTNSSMSPQAGPLVAWWVSSPQHKVALLSPKDAPQPRERPTPTQSRKFTRQC